MQNLAEISASALYSQNWLLAANSVDYMASTNTASLVQHFWSLSVEEQFYVLWPLIVVLTCLLRRGRRSILIILALIVLVSLSTSVAQTLTDPGPAYFSTATRAWEFAAGGMLAFVPMSWVNARPRLQRRLAAALGLAMILCACVFFDDVTPFPGIAAAVPVLGTLVVIWAGGSGDAPFAGLWSTHAVTFVGAASYSIYLWHWPLIVVCPFLLKRDMTAVDKVVVIMITILLAALSKRYIEDPARRHSGWIGSNRSAFSFMAISVVVVVSLTVSTSAAVRGGQDSASTDIRLYSASDPCAGYRAIAAGCADPHAMTSTVNSELAATDLPWRTGVPSYSEWACETPEDILPRCSSQAGEVTSFTIALVGDSHADHLLEPLTAAARESGWLLLPYTKAGCSSFEDTNQGTASCREWAYAVRQELLTRENVDLVLFSNYSTHYDLDPDRATSLVSELAAHGVAVAFVRDTPAAPFAVPLCLERPIRSNDPCSWNSDDSTTFVDAVIRQTGSPALDTADLICADGICHAVIGGLVTYADDNHYTSAFARTLSEVLKPRLTAIVNSLVSVEEDALSAPHAPKGLGR